jgi:hypothetical protein
MGLVEEVEQLKKKAEQLGEDRPSLLRLQRVIKEKSEKGIITKKSNRFPTLQDAEHFSYKILFAGRRS